jgi:hypothetical protein
MFRSLYAAVLIFAFAAKALAAGVTDLIGFIIVA